MFVSIESIAQVCHETNRAYCKIIGDLTQKPWDESPEWQKKSAIAGVEFCIKNPDAPPSANHESWLKQKEADGWKFGEVKDDVRKEHPCFVPYDELPIAQRAKDFLFKNVVSSFLNCK